MEPIAALIIGLAFYLIPTFVALKRGHHNSTAIIVLNILAGWILIGWIIALIWACTAVKPELGGGKKK